VIAVMAAAIMLTAGAGTALAGQFNVTKSGSLVEVPRSGVPAATGSGQSTGSTIVRVTTASGFSWGDAAIGAGSIVAIGALLLGGGLVMSDHRRRIGHA
jgi:hypothetical protein